MSLIDRRFSSELAEQFANLDEQRGHSVYGNPFLNVLPIRADPRPSAGPELLTRPAREDRPPLAVDNRLAPSGIDLDRRLVGVHQAQAVPAAEAMPVDGAATVEVQQGDGFDRIAARLLGAGASPQQVRRLSQQLADYNGVSDLRSIRVGQTLRLPPDDWAIRQGTREAFAAEDLWEILSGPAVAGDSVENAPGVAFGLPFYRQPNFPGGTRELRRRLSPPPSQQSPYPSRARRSSPGVDPRTPGLGQPTPGTSPSNYPRGKTVTAVGDVAAVVNELGDWDRFLKYLGTRGDFERAGGWDAVQRKTLPNQTSLEPEILRDFQGNTGVRMENGEEFWRRRFPFDPRPQGFNLQIRDVDGVRWYRVFGGEWTTEPPSSRW